MFCEIAFEKVKCRKGGLSLLQFRDVVVLHPQLLNFFHLDEVLSGGIDLQFSDDDADGDELDRSCGIYWCNKCIVENLFGHLFHAK